MSGLLTLLAPWVIIPAIILALVPRSLRLTIAVLGLLFSFGIGLVMDLGGPDSPALILPLYGLAVAFGAVLGEFMAIFVRGVRQRHPHG